MAGFFHYISCGLFFFFFFAGLIFCMKTGLRLLLRPMKNSEIVIRLHLTEKSEDTEFALREAIDRLRWFRGEIPSAEILCIDEGMQEESLRICEIFKRKYPYIRIVKP